MWRKFRKLLKLMAVGRWRRAVLTHGVAATIEHHALLRARKFDTIVDVGANRGQFSLAARHWQSDARIFAFEPLASAADVYAGVFSADAGVTLFRSAVSSVRGVAQMHVSKREDSSSLLPISELQTTHYQGTDAKGSIEVAAAPLVDFLSPDQVRGAALLKIDVQGFELEVLKSSIDLLGKFAAVYVEVSFLPLYSGQALAHQVIDFLREQGFAVAGVANLSLDSEGTALQVDMLFLPAGPISEVT